MNKNKSHLSLHLKKTNSQQFNINYKRRSVKGAVACFIGRWVRSVCCVHCVTYVACVVLDGNPALLVMKPKLPNKGHHVVPVFVCLSAYLSVSLSARLFTEFRTDFDQLFGGPIIGSILVATRLDKPGYGSS